MASVVGLAGEEGDGAAELEVMLYFLIALAEDLDDQLV